MDTKKRWSQGATGGGIYLGTVARAGLSLGRGHKGGRRTRKVEGEGRRLVATVAELR